MIRVFGHPFSCRRWPCVVAGLAALLLPGCGLFGSSDGSRAGNTGPALVEPVEARIDAVTGMTLVIPVRATGKDGADLSDPDTARAVKVFLDDGQALTSALRWITVRPDESALREGSIVESRWLPPAGTWRTQDHPPVDPGLTMLVLAVDLPPDAVGRDLLIGPRRVRMNWLPSPALIAADPAATLDPAIPKTLREARSLVDLARPERLSPVRRWRWRLLMTGLHPAAEPPAITGELRRFADPLLEALAEQYEARWAVALGTLAKSDPALARELAARVCAVTRFEDGLVAPVWPLDQGDLESLLADLLDPDAGVPQRKERARVWLASQPPALAWVIDDAAEQDGTTGQPVTWIGMANLQNRPALAWAAWLDAFDREIGPQPELVPLGPLSTMQRPLAVARDAVIRDRRKGEGDPAPLAMLAVHVGEFEQQLRVDVSSVEAAPPSVALGPLESDATLDGFLAGRTSGVIDGAWSTAAVLYRDRGDGVEGAGSGGAEGPASARWVLYIRCARPQAPDDADLYGDARTVDDALRLHIGGRSHPRMVLRIDESGSAAREDDRGSQGAGAAVRVVREKDRWIAIVTIPAECIENRGVLRIGIERMDSRGVRSAWPRAMLPWQKFPGRVMVDLGAWDRE